MDGGRGGSGKVGKGASRTASKVLKMIPIIGAGVAVESARQNWQEGNYIQATVDVIGIFVDPVDWASAALPLLPAAMEANARYLDALPAGFPKKVY